MGSADLKEMDAGGMDSTGRSLTNAGKILGIIATVLLAVGVVITVLVFGLGLLGAAASH